MIGGISQGKAERIISLPKDETPEDFELTRQWKKFFLIFGGTTVLAVAVFEVRLVTADDNWWRSLVLLGGMLILDSYVLYKYLKVRVFARKRFKAQLAKFGREELLSQLQSPTAKGFFIEPGDYGNLMVVTDGFLIAANEFIYDLNDVSRIVIEKEYYDKSRVEKQKSERVRMLLKCAYSMKVSVNSGKTRRELISVRQEDLGGFVGALQQRAPEAEVKLISLT